MTPRTVEDRLREEYFFLAPEIKRVLHQLQTDVAYLLLPATLDLKHHERIHVEARAKDCDSAINALRRREEARQFDQDAPTRYTLTSRPDLVGLRVLVDNLGVATNYRLDSLTLDYMLLPKTTLSAIWYHYEPRERPAAATTTFHDSQDRLRIHVLVSF